MYIMDNDSDSLTKPTKSTKPRSEAQQAAFEKARSARQANLEIKKAAATAKVHAHLKKEEKKLVVQAIKEQLNGMSVAKHNESDADEIQDDYDDEPVPQPKNKKPLSVQDDSDDDLPVPPKKKKHIPIQEDSDDEPLPPPKKKLAKKPAKKFVEESDSEPEEIIVVKRKKKTIKKTIIVEDSSSDDDLPPPQPSRQPRSQQHKNSKSIVQKARDESMFF